MILTVVVEEQTIKDEFSEMVLGFLELALQTKKLPALDTPNQPLRSKELSDYVYEGWEQFWKNLLLQLPFLVTLDVTGLTEARKERVQGFRFPASSP